MGGDDADGIAVDGRPDGSGVSCVGSCDGNAVDGSHDGAGVASVGRCDGNCVGSSVGTFDGPGVGLSVDGTGVGAALDGMFVGSKDGAGDGNSVG